MKAMQNRIVAVIINLVLTMAIIVVASTMSSDVTGNNEGEQNKLDNSSNMVEADASLAEIDELYVGLSAATFGQLEEGENSEQVADTTNLIDLGDSMDAQNVEFNLADVIVKSKYEDTFLVNVSEYLNVRVDMDSESEVVGKVFAGQGGKVIWQNDTWSFIRSGNVEGYIKNEYAWFGDDVEAHIDEVAQLYAIVTADKLRVRANANSSGTILGMVVKGEQLEVLSKGEEWTKVKFEHASAYVATDYIKTEHIIGTGLTIEEEQEEIRAEAERQAAIKAEEERKKKEAEEALERAIQNSGFANTVQTSAYSVSEKDAYLMAACVSAEVGSSSYECQLAVANIILNRLKSGKHGSTAKDVIYESGQFSVTRNGSMDRYIKNGPRATSVQAVKDALAGKNNMVGYYSFTYLPSADFSQYSSYVILGTEVFYRR